MDTTLNSAMEVLNGAGISVLDSARYIRNILDAKPAGGKLTDAQFVLKVIEVGLRHIRAKEMSLADGFAPIFKEQAALAPRFHKGYSLYRKPPFAYEARTRQAQLFGAYRVRMRGMAECGVSYQLAIQAKRE